MNSANCAGLHMLVTDAPIPKESSMVLGHHGGSNQIIIPSTCEAVVVRFCILPQKVVLVMTSRNPG